MSAPPRSDVPGELWVPEPGGEDWSGFGGERLAVLDREMAAILAQNKLSTLTEHEAMMQNYSVAHDRATRLARANTELRINTLLERTMPTDPFAKTPQPWRGTTAQALVKVQEFSSAIQAKWLSGYSTLIDRMEGLTRRPWTFPAPLPAYDWETLIRLLSFEGDAKYWRDIRYGVRPSLAMARARLRMQSLAQSVHQNAEQQTLYALLGDNSRVKGWQRMCAPNACPWCCLLSSRGGVYRTYETAAFGRKGLYHLPRDNCTARPVFRRYERLPQLTNAAEQRVLYAQALYEDVNEDVRDGAEPVNPLAARRLVRGEPKRSVYMDEFLYHAYRDPLFRPRPRLTLGRRFTGRYEA